MTLGRRLLMGGSGGSFPAPLTITSGSRLDVMTGTGYKAFPGMCMASTRQHLVYRTGTAHNNANGSIDYKYTDDAGATWSDPGSALTLTTASGSNDYRDPALLVTSTGRLLVVTTLRSPWNSTTFDPYAFYSDDNGATWPVSPYTISFTGANAYSTSQPIEVAGSIYVPGTVENGADYYAVMWKSTDDGLTFTQIGVAGDGTVRDYQEAQVRVLASGLWVALLRSESNHHTWRCESADGTTWSSPVDVNAMTGRPDFVEIAPDVLVQFGRYLTTADSPGYWAISYDAGVNWTTPVEVDPGGTALWMYGSPLVVGSTVRLVYSLENSSSDADLFQRNYAVA